MQNSNKKIPRARNKHASVLVSGYAITPGRVAVYLSLVGPKNAAKSIWASAVNNPRQSFVIDHMSVTGGDSARDGYYQFWQDLPEQMAAHLILAHKAMFDVVGKGDQPFYLVATDHDLKHNEILLFAIPDHEIARRYYRDEALDPASGARLAQADNEYTQLYFDHPIEGSIPALDTPEHWAMLRTQAHELRQSQHAIEVLLLPRFIALLNKSLDIPLHKVWAKAMWDAGVRQSLIQTCRQGGHVRAADRVLTTATKWQDIVQEGLEERTLVMPQPVTSIEVNVASPANTVNTVKVVSADHSQEAPCA